MVKGYSGWVIEMYNNHTNPEISVGEFLDNDTSKVIGWIDSTHEDWRKRSAAFDFPLRNALYQAVSFGNYHYLKYYDNPTGVMGLWKDKSVTFVENHDSEECRVKDGYLPPFQNGDSTSIRQPTGICCRHSILGYFTIVL